MKKKKAEKLEKPKAAAENTIDNKRKLKKFFLWKLLKKKLTQSLAHEVKPKPASQESQIITHLERFRRLRVSEVMIPRAEIIAVRLDTDLMSLLDKFISTSFTRIPVYKTDLDNMIGFVHIKDILPYAADRDKGFQISNLLHLFIYAARSTKCLDLLSNMRRDGMNFAVILDEYGGCEGVVTIELLTEEILGDIKDEHDDKQKQDQNFLEKLGPRTYVVDGRMPIEALVEALDGTLTASSIFSEEEGEYETMAGFIISYLDKIPTKGEKFSHPAGIEIEILEADQRRVRLVKLKLI